MDIDIFLDYTTEDIVVFGAGRIKISRVLNVRLCGQVLFGFVFFSHGIVIGGRVPLYREPEQSFQQDTAITFLARDAELIFVLIPGDLHFR